MYALEVVPAAWLDFSHLYVTMSPEGITVMHGDHSEFLTVAQWAWERDKFRQVLRHPLFRQFRARSAYWRWKSGVQQRRFRRRRYATPVLSLARCSRPGALVAEP